jgi:LysM repeat protein
MQKQLPKVLIVTASLCLSALLLAACTRSVDTAVPTTAPETGGGETQGVLPGDANAAATQTKAAADATNAALMNDLLNKGLTQTAQAVAGVTTTPTTQPGGTTAVPAATTAAPPAAATTPAPSTGPKKYVVKAGDWLYKIARENGVTPQALIAANPQINPNAILRPGTELTIPAGGTPVPGSGSTGQKTYVVKPGDNLFRIGLNNKTTYLKLAELNGIKPPYTVYPGQVIKLP